MDISEASKLSNLPASTLRYYEEKGLLKSVGRHGLKRVFPSDVVQRLAFISLGRAAGLSLDEIKSMLLPNRIEVDRELLVSKAEELDTKIHQLEFIRDGLKKAADCKASNHLDCSGFSRLLHIANQRWGKSNRGKVVRER